MCSSTPIRTAPRRAGATRSAAAICRRRRTCCTRRRTASRVLAGDGLRPSHASKRCRSSSRASSGPIPRRRRARRSRAAGVLQPQARRSAPRDDRVSDARTLVLRPTTFRRRSRPRRADVATRRRLGAGQSSAPMRSNARVGISRACRLRSRDSMATCTRSGSAVASCGDSRCADDEALSSWRSGTRAVQPPWTERELLDEGAHARGGMAASRSAACWKRSHETSPMRYSLHDRNATTLLAAY